MFTATSQMILFCDNKKVNIYHSNPENTEMMYHKITFLFFYFLGNKSNNFVLSFFTVPQRSGCFLLVHVLCSIVSFILVIPAKISLLVQNRSPLPSGDKKSQLLKKILWFHQNFSSKTPSFRSPRMF